MQPPVVLGVTIHPTPLFGFATAQFADPIHPTAVLDGLIANEIIVPINLVYDDTEPFYDELEL